MAKDWHFCRIFCVFTVTYVYLLCELVCHFHLRREGSVSPQRYLQLFCRVEVYQHYIKGNNDKQFFIFSLKDDMKDERGRLPQRLTASHKVFIFFAKLLNAEYMLNALTLFWRAASLQQKHHPALSNICHCLVVSLNFHLDLNFTFWFTRFSMAALMSRHRVNTVSLACGYKQKVMEMWGDFSILERVLHRNNCSHKPVLL